MGGGGFQPAWSFQTYKRDEAWAWINTAQPKLLSEEMYPLDLSWGEKKNLWRKAEWRKEVLGAPPVSCLEFLQPLSAFQGAWKWGRGAWKKWGGFIKKGPGDTVNPPLALLFSLNTQDDRDGLCIWNNPWRAMKELSSLLHWSIGHAGVEEIGRAALQTERNKTTLWLKQDREKDTEAAESAAY